MIRNALDNGNFVCGVFIDLQKAFDTLNHDILLSKLNHYIIRSLAFDWLKSYLSNRIQYKTINNETTRLHLRTLLISHIHNLKIHHFSDDTNLKDINKKLNFDLLNQVQWLRAIKIALQGL